MLVLISIFYGGLIGWWLRTVYEQRHARQPVPESAPESEEARDAQDAVDRQLVRRGIVHVIGPAGAHEINVGPAKTMCVVNGNRALRGLPPLEWPP